MCYCTEIRCGISALAKKFPLTCSSMSLDCCKRQTSGLGSSQVMNPGGPQGMSTLHRLSAPRSCTSKTLFPSTKRSRALHRRMASRAKARRRVRLRPQSKAERARQPRHSLRRSPAGARRARAARRGREARRRKGRRRGRQPRRGATARRGWTWRRCLGWRASPGGRARRGARAWAGTSAWPGTSGPEPRDGQQARTRAKACGGGRAQCGVGRACGATGPGRCREKAKRGIRPQAAGRGKAWYGASMHSKGGKAGEGDYQAWLGGPPWVHGKAYGKGPLFYGCPM
mmetsp:Transcript_42814/g.132534  ORF Transcript_42814/g.132534 Transcript_42814/m.132534 type:complete len:285 (+) Transcript_42814:703-1557(+)